MIVTSMTLIALGATPVRAQSFIIDCKPSHLAPDDPIVFPGVPGAAHLHEFFGNTSTNASSTYATMIGKPTTCSVVGDTAGYWVPALLNAAGQRIAPRRITVYYRDRPQASRPVTPFPPDFRMIAGSPQAGVWGFNCDDIALAPTTKDRLHGLPHALRSSEHHLPELRAAGRPREHREGLGRSSQVMSRTRSRRRPDAPHHIRSSSPT